MIWAGRQQNDWAGEETKCSGMLVGAVAGETQSISFDEKVELKP